MSISKLQLHPPPKRQSSFRSRNRPPTPYSSFISSMDDSTGEEEGDVPLEISVLDNNTQGGSTTTSSSIRNDGSFSASTSTMKSLPAISKFLPLSLPNKDRWESSSQSESKHARASPRLPRRNRTEPLECHKDLFQLGSPTPPLALSRRAAAATGPPSPPRRTFSDDSSKSGFEDHIDDRIKLIRGMRIQLDGSSSGTGNPQRRQQLVLKRSKSEGDALRTGLRLSPLASRSVHLPR